jgi:DNA-binding helix-hairpin-helix protein with protein kinase domain
LQIPPKIYDSQGRLLPFGRRIGRGGEGEVYELAQDPKLVAKVYHKPVPKERAEKIRAMVRLKTEPLTQVAAWPVDTCHYRPGAEVSGLVMPKVSGHEEIHNLYSPKNRLSSFPAANWQFLIRSAANLARAFAVVHDHGHLVGDVNHGNVLVSHQATVRLIDCDSFQVRGTDGYPFLCEVGVSTHVPPELQGGSLRVLRTEDHDGFGLAVVIFQILFMGRHPYSGHYLGPGDMPIEKAIREHRFAYGVTASSRQMRQPPNTLDLAAASQPVAALFERAFSPQAAQGAPRPRARDWVTALETVKTTKCSRNAAHLYLAGLAVCPWCDLEARSGTVFFYFVSVQAPGTVFSLAAVWTRISATPGPGALPAIPTPAAYLVQPSAGTLEAAKQKKGRYAVAALAVLAGVALGFYLGGCSAALVFAVSIALATGLAAYKSPKHQEAQQRLKDVQEQLRRLGDLWPLQAGDGPFRIKLAELETLRKEYLDLSSLRTRKLAALEADRRSTQMERFLDQYRIDRARISGISHGRTATLQSYGIETAADIQKRDILQIPGFGPVLTDTLMRWRQSIELKFVFDPSKGIDPADIAAVDRSIAVRKDHIERKLLAGAAELEKLRHQISIRRQALFQQLEAAAKVVAQAEADFKAL